MSREEEAHPVAAFPLDTSTPRHLDTLPPLPLLLYPTSKSAYGLLCRLLTLGKRRASKGECRLAIHDVIEHSEGMLAVVVPPRVLDSRFIETLRGLRDVFDDDRLSLALTPRFEEDDTDRLWQVGTLGAHLGVPLVATNDVRCHVPERRPLQDVLTCIRHGCTLDSAGFRLHPNAERHLKPPEEMARLLARFPGAVERAAEIAGRCAGFSLDQIRYEYPDEVVPAGETAMSHLTSLAWRGAAERYPQGTPAKVRAQIEHELRLIDELNYAPYFLTVHDLVVFARSRGILCQGRGAAANSAVCYMLGVTSVDPSRIDVLFERFISRERNEPPDIDIDFEHERREEVIQYLYAKYGRDRAALTAEVITYRGRSAIREVGKALGLSLDAVDRLAKSLDWWDKGIVRDERFRELGLNPEDRTLRLFSRLATEILGFPRHLSQHVGGFVITRTPLCELVPIENAAMEGRTVIEWDKDDIDALGMLKVDVLGLGMLTCLRRGFEMVNAWGGTKGKKDSGTVDSGQWKVDIVTGGPTPLFPLSTVHCPLSPCPSVSLSLCPPLSLSTLPLEDPAVYDMICEADTIGVFQVESRAQMAMSPRLRPRCYYDLVIEVAIVRPGPIQGGMVHPYLRRRAGIEAVVYPDERVKGVLGKTLGVPLFQEQAMALAMVAAGFTAGEADQLRRAMAAWKGTPNAILKFERRLIDGMLARGYTREYAETVFRQIQGFSGYGFPESHAASFAHLVYASAWMKRYHPAAFAAALINSQPMGFYAPAQIVRDAASHGVEVRPVDVNRSAWECSLEEVSRCRGVKVSREEEEEAHPVAAFPLDTSTPRHLDTSSPALRLGLCLVSGLAREEGERIVAAVRRDGAFGAIAALWRASGVRVSTLQRLARADAFASMGLTRQHALWEVRALTDEEMPLFDEKVSMCRGAGEEVSRCRGVKVSREDKTLGADVEDCSSSSTLDTLTPRHLDTTFPDPLPPIPPMRVIAQDYASIGLSLKQHPVALIRERLAAAGAVPAFDLRDAARLPHGSRAKVAGIVLVRQRPSTASGIVFITLEDETGVANLILRPEVYQRFRRAARHSVVLLANGRVERQGVVVHVIVDRMWSVDHAVEALSAHSRDFH